MSGKILILVGGVIGFLLCTHLCSATVINVPTDQPTIQAGIDAAVDGDTVLVAPGTWKESLLIESKAIAIYSESGPMETRLEPTAEENIRIIDATDHPEEEYDVRINGFTVVNDISCNRGIWATRSYIAVENCIMEIRGVCILSERGVTRIRYCHFKAGQPCTGYEHSFAIWCTGGGGSSEIAYNLFDNIDKKPTVFILNEGAHIYNNTFVTCRGGVSFQSLFDIGRVYNNIFYHCIDYGLHSSRPTLRADYNLYFENGSDIIGDGAVGPHSLHIAALFTDPDSGDFTLQYDSPAIDAGNPDEQYLDPDGTINDIGAFFSPSELPVPVNLNLGDENRYRVINHNPLINWSFFDTSYMQFGYEIQVGDDRDWTVAENWKTGDIYTADNSILYAGLPLEDGHAYTCRVRLNNGTNWGSWRYGYFRMNDEPSVPSLRFPINGSPINQNVVILIVDNSTQQDTDQVRYDFMLSLDSAGFYPMAIDTGVTEQETLTSSRLFGEPVIGPRYWWRARASDGHEFSSWSVPESFILRASGTMKIPSEQRTLMAGIHAVDDGDTILVAPGTYSGDWNRDLDFSGKLIVLRSEAGPESTVIDCGGTTIEPHRGILLQNGEDSTVVIEGMTIIGGYASGLEKGGAILCHTSSPRLVNCVFKNNTAYLGSAVSCKYSDAVLINCTFLENSSSAPGSGGSLLCSHSELVVRDCTFEGNLGTAIYSYESSMKLHNCRFVENSTPAGGAALYFWAGHQTLTECTFLYNSAAGIGGAIQSEGACPTLIDCEFIKNSAGAWGGAVNLSGAWPTFIDCRFFGNYAYRDGGAVRCEERAKAIFDGCIFDGNTARQGGGILCGFDSPATVTECLIMNNFASGRGGGICAGVPLTSIDGCFFLGNEATQGGGVFFASGTTPVINCTFANNISPQGGAFYLRRRSSPVFENCIITSNTGGKTVFCEAGASQLFTCCDIYGNEQGDWVGSIAGQFGIMAISPQIRCFVTYRALMQV